MGGLSAEEQKVLDGLVAVWNDFLELPELHPWHRQEMMHAIHDAQRIVMVRPVIRTQTAVSQEGKVR